MVCSATIDKPDNQIHRYSFYNKHADVPVGRAITVQKPIIHRKYMLRKKVLHWTFPTF